jgi:hypothetical protein
MEVLATGQRVCDNPIRDTKARSLPIRVLSWIDVRDRVGMEALRQSQRKVRPSFWASLDQPLPEWACILGWCGATGLFILLIVVLGGPSNIDSVESMYSTWAIAHGHFSCALPTDAVHRTASYEQPFTSIAPIYPLVSAGIAALTRLGSHVPFPSATALGAHCQTGPQAMYRWAINANVFHATYRMGYVGWLFLMTGAVAFLRAVGRGRRGWEPVTLFVLACLPPVWSAVGNIFHPEDLVAMGLILGGVACIFRRWWALAGILLALAVLSQQFALLVAAPLFVVVPSTRKLRFSVAGLVTAAVVVIPLLVLSSGNVLRAVVFGSGDSSGAGGTAVRLLRLHGWMLTGVSRVFPIVLSMVLAWWLLRRLGASVRDPRPLTALVALSLSLRLVFEENLHHTYYFMALAVALLLLDVVCGRIRGTFVAWVILGTFAYNAGFAGLFNRVSWRLGASEHIPEVLIVLGLILLIADFARGRVRWYVVAWLGIMIGAFVSWPFTTESLRGQLPFLFWQVVLVSTGIWLAAGPLVRFIRERDDFQTPDTTPPTGVLGSTDVPVTSTSPAMPD